MAGERTPSLATSGLPSADDDISLREHMQRQLDINREMAITRFAMEREHCTETFAALRAWLVEQDKRYEQRFVAQENAVTLALARVDKEFHEHLRSVQEETKAALQSADKAITKSESATEKRFESVNEFRAQLGDQAQTFMPRKESDVRMDSLTEKIDLNAQRLNDLQLRVSSRLDISESSHSGGREAIMDKRTANGAVLALVGMGITVVLAVLAVLTFILAQSGNP